jgi:hypothetical protein
MAAAKEPLIYVTTHPSSVLFDILAKGEVIRGQWHDYPQKRTISFAVPPDLVESFEGHYHFQSGNVVKYVPTSEPINNEPKKERAEKPKKERADLVVDPLPPVSDEAEGA